MASTELVGPLPTVIFRGAAGVRGVRVVLNEALPKNTLDPRYRQCSNHRTACVCREAEQAEQRAELTSMWDDARTAAAEVLKGHRTWPETYREALVTEGGISRWEYEFDASACCSCTGCQIARKAYLR